MRGNLVGNCSCGMMVLRTNTTIEGNFVGIDRSGNGVVPINGPGIFTLPSATFSVIRDNVIASCMQALQHHAHSCTIQGNRIGTESAGLVTRGNGDGIVVSVESYGNLIGGPHPHHANIVSGNTFSGLVIAGSENMVQNNYIGTDAVVSFAIPNLLSGVRNSGRGNIFLDNVISGNGGRGMYLMPGTANVTVQGCLIGASRSGNATIGNVLEGLVMVATENTLVGGLNVVRPTLPRETAVTALF